MKRVVRGLRHSLEDNFVENVLYRACKTIKEVRESVEEAFERNADMVIIEKIKE